MKYKSLQEIQQNPVWIKLQSKGTDKKQLNQQFLSLTEDEKVIAIDLFESLKVVMEDLLKKIIHSIDNLNFKHVFLIFYDII